MDFTVLFSLTALNRMLFKYRDPCAVDLWKLPANKGGCGCSEEGRLPGGHSVLVGCSELVDLESFKNFITKYTNDKSIANSKKKKKKTSDKFLLVSFEYCPPRQATLVLKK